jgi:hypothetical protein
MTVIILKEKDSYEISRLVNELKNTGYKVGIDFDFEYSSGKWDITTGHIPRQTKFTFYNSKLATWFSLKWV